MQAIRLLWVTGALGLVAARAAAQDEVLEERINVAIEKGVKSIRQAQAKAGHWDHSEKLGMSALCAWTLLESGVPAKDEAMVKAAGFIRQEAVNLSILSRTYSAAATIFFLDRLGDPADEPLIQALAAQLLAGQRQTAGWSYYLPRLSAKDRDQVKDRMEAIKANPPEPAKAPVKESEKEPAKEKPKPNKELLRLVGRLRAGGIPLASLPEDNSNTQFAMMALWVARRHGVPVDDALSRVEARFRKAQQEQGTWSYAFDPKNLKGSGRGLEPSPAFTCAGLLAFALGQGVKKEAKVSELLKDPAVKKGVDAVAKSIDQFSKGKFLEGKDGAKNYYFLWSLERMGVVFDLKKIGTRDWYVWGAEGLCDQLERRGRWGGEYGMADTCFAVLFLKRANVAHDLTKQLKLFNPIQKDK